jgi:hypothetical protein
MYAGFEGVNTESSFKMQSPVFVLTSAKVTKEVPPTVAARYL